MEIGRFEIEINDKKIIDICKKILEQEQINKILQICEQYGTEKDEVRKYDVYLIETSSGYKILKKSDDREISNYERYLNKGNFNVPRYFGKYVDGEDVWILLENIPGADLRDMTNDLAILAADSITAIQNVYWNCKDSDRFEAYWDRINKRYQYIRKEPIIGEAYHLFLQRQEKCPRTMSNGDFLQFNTVMKDDRVFVIDWGFGGIMPYSLDIARFIAHGTEDKATFPFYMNGEQKQIFVQRVYEKLVQKPEYEQFLMDIKLAVLNEYVEFVEADEDEEKWYFEHAKILAKEIMDGRIY